MKTLKRWPMQLVALMALILVLGACNGCSILQKKDGTPTTALEHAKIVQKAADSAWTAVQETFAKSRLAAEKSEKAGQPLAAGQITLDQWKRFTALDAKVIPSGRELAKVTSAVVAGTSKDENRMALLTAELFDLFGQTQELAKAFGLAIPGLPVSAPVKSSSLPLELAALPLGLALRPRRRLPAISGGSGIDPEMVTSIAAGMINSGGPLVADWVTNNPEDQAKAEAAAKLLSAFLGGLAKQLPAIMEGIQDPASINLDALWDEDAEQVLERLRRQA